MIRIGIDVGGTNTDGVAIRGSRVVTSSKFPTTGDVLSGVVAALRHVASATGADGVDSVVIGTTHFVNAVTEARGLAPVVAIRMATPPASLPPFSDWPERLRTAISGEVHVVAGGHQFDGQPMNVADLGEVRRIATSACAADRHEFVVSSVFSPVIPDGEAAAAAVIREACAHARITQSHQIGRIGLLERENAALLNGGLRPLAAHVIDGLRRALEGVGLSVPLFLSQNDGTVMNLDTAREFPILTVASGPTNSMRGAGFVSGESDCVVIDVGGTTTDVGLLRGGFPRESTLAMHLGGVRTNFRMPDVVSVGLGGGSLVRATPDGVTVGPDSVGYEITTRALVFGGTDLTLTDVAVAAGRAAIGDAGQVAHLDRDLVAGALAHVDEVVAQLIDRVKVQAGDVPAVTVGGGAVLLPATLPGTLRVVTPSEAGVANAIGAAMANVGGEVDRVFALGDLSRLEVMEAARQEATERAVAAGASRGTIRVLDEEDVPLTHLPGGTATRIRVRVAGDRRGATTPDGTRRTLDEGA